MSDTNTKLTQKDVNDICWNACDTFRGVIDASQYKDYILVMLFMKYISDVYKDRHDHYMQEYGGNTVRVDRAMSLERFVLPAESHFDYLYENRKADNIGEVIDIGIAALEDANKVKLKVFQNITFNTDRLGETKSRNKILQNLLNDFNNPRLDLRPSRIDEDVIGEAYMYLIERFGSDAGKKAGEFYTPAPVRKLVAALAKPKAKDLICDPTCGSGSLLVDAVTLYLAATIGCLGRKRTEAHWPWPK